MYLYLLLFLLFVRGATALSLATTHTITVVVLDHARARHASHSTQFNVHFQIPSTIHSSASPSFRRITLPNNRKSLHFFFPKNELMDLTPLDAAASFFCAAVVVAAALLPPPPDEDEEEGPPPLLLPLPLPPSGLNRCGVHVYLWSAGETFAGPSSPTAT